MSLLEDILRVEQELERVDQDITVEQEAHDLSRDLTAFVKRAWPFVEPNAPYIHGWHIEAICKHLEAASAGDIRRLQIWVPPGTSKSSVCSIIWPAWEWTSNPGVRYLTGSYDIDLATRFAVRSRNLIQSFWYQRRWGTVFGMKRDENLKRSYANDRGGERFATSPTAGATGRHAHRILIDDPLNAKAIVSDNSLDEVIDWHDGSLSTRWADPMTGVEVIIMQRLHMRDLAGHLLERDGWTVLCLPERYEAAHPFVWPEDPREEGELIQPLRRGEKESSELAATLGSSREAGQLQQRPAPREGAILKRGMWRYFDPDLLKDPDDLTSAGANWTHLPKFRQIVSSWDTTFKATTTSDFVVGTLWGVDGGRRYMLAVDRGKMTLSQAKQAMRNMREWALARWPEASHSVLIENTANGPEIIMQLKREIPGVIATKPSVSADQPAAKKTVRAEACEPDFESGSVLVPGWANTGLTDYGPGTPPDIQEFIEECAMFPNGNYDDRVDSLTQALNHIRTRGSGEGRTFVPQGRTD